MPLYKFDSAMIAALCRQITVHYIMICAIVMNLLVRNILLKIAHLLKIICKTKMCLRVDCKSITQKIIRTEVTFKTFECID